MILIKDRHPLEPSLILLNLNGKYDTYKGSTLLLLEKTTLLMFVMGNMILIKDRHLLPLSGVSMKVVQGNMILIKDRHSNSIESMI